MRPPNGGWGLPRLIDFPVLASKEETPATLEFYVEFVAFYFP